MKKLLIALLTVAMLGSAGTLVKASKLDKVTICHATGSATNPYVKITVSPNAISGHFNNNGTPKHGHEDDILLEGDTDCPAPTPPPGGGGGNGGGGGGCTHDCDHDDDDDDHNPPGGGGGGCTLPAKITSMDVQNATPNDHTLEVVWNTNQATGMTLNIRYGIEDGIWTGFVNGTANDGFEAIAGLTNGVHYWFQIQATNNCGSGEWSASIDPLP